ncbi:hypothetical protein C3942_20680 [Solimonas fluminis]|uniref:Uncharacterized protein n=1 Tax=Solimonas fluminis TaxID=2086571 RepID=A0A2S5TAG6_9GAMM|nr:hypothetical protein C3942_20680 [Solimonas fluminis]
MRRRQGIARRHPALGAQLRHQRRRARCADQDRDLVARLGHAAGQAARDRRAPRVVACGERDRHRALDESGLCAAEFGNHGGIMPPWFPSGHHRQTVSSGPCRPPRTRYAVRHGPPAASLRSSRPA